VTVHILMVLSNEALANIEGSLGLIAIYMI